MGDGIMALFGAPLAHEDHAVRACYAALRMQDSIKRYAEGVRRVEGVPIRIRVGLNSGDVVVRAIRNDLHMDYTAVGQTTHLAARMEQLANPGATLMTASTFALAADFLQISPRGPTPVRGLAESVEVYELFGANTIRSRFQAQVSHGLTKFVGRSAEIAQLTEFLDLARNGRGQIAAVVGEPGVGKSRLFWEFLHSRRTEGCLIVESASVSHGRSTTYLPVIELLRRYFRIDADDDIREIREKVSRKLLSLAHATESDAPALLALLDVPVEEHDWTQLDPPQRRRQTVDAVKRLLLNESHLQPLVVVFEDLHWIDGETQAFLDELVESLPAARLLLLVNFRPEYQHAWFNKTYYQQVRVNPLASPNAEELLTTMLGDDPRLEPLRRSLIARTEGNPFFLEESVKTLVETGVLTGQAGTYRLTKTPQELLIPATAQAMVAARIDRLEPDDKHLLQTASVIGKDVPFALLKSVAELREDELRHGLARLQGAEFLYETGLFPEMEYTFKHALTHEVAYGGLTQARRRELHALIMTSIEGLSADRIDEHVERLAHHALLGQTWDKAATYQFRAAVKAVARFANRDAAARFSDALQALDRLPVTDEIQKRRIDVRLELWRAHFSIGAMHEIPEDLREAEELANQRGDRQRLGQVLAAYSRFFWATGQFPHARAASERALKIAEEACDPILVVGATHALGSVLVMCGELRAAEGNFRRVIDFAARDEALQRLRLTTFAIPSAHAWLSIVNAERGLFADALEHGQEGFRIAESLQHPHTIAWALHGWAWAHNVRGDFADAIRLLERALVIAREESIGAMEPAISSALGHAYTRLGRVRDGVVLLNRGLELIGGGTGGLTSLVGTQWLADAHLLQAEFGSASEQAQRALTLARERGERVSQSTALWLLGEVERSSPSGVAGIAEVRYREALVGAEELELRPLAAHCHLALGKLYRRTGEPEQAQEHLTTATAMYREMGMTYWLEKAAAS
jgi:tetratricopeptide (TPR) repeat protein